MYRDTHTHAVVTTFHDITALKRVQQERLAHTQFVENLARVNSALHGTNDLEQMMSDVLGTVLSIFDCDRAWLVFPCDPDASTWSSTMERTRPEYPSAASTGEDRPMDAGVATAFRVMLAASGPVRFGPHSEYPVPPVSAQLFNVQSFIGMALRPKGGKPWAFGLHQCSYPRVWTKDEEKLFQEVGLRLTDGLTSLWAHRNLQRSEREFRSLAENLPDIIARVDTNGRYLYVNPVMPKLSGLPAESFLGKRMGEARLAAGHSPIEAGIELMWRVFRQAVAGGVAQECEYSVPDRFGGGLFELRLNPELDANGQVCSVLCIARNITERRRSEQALRESEFRFRAVVQAMPVMINALDERGLIVAWNQECERLSGYLAEEVIGNPKALERLYPDPEYRAKLFDGSMRDQDQGYWHQPWDMVCKDGSVRTIEWSLGTAQANIPGWAEWSIGVDVTERRQLERSLLDVTRKEQHRLGQELHDGLGQELCGLALLANGLAKRRGSVSNTMARDLKQLADIASQAIRNCRSIARGLSPLSERQGGLIEALRALTTAQRSDSYEAEVLLAEVQTAPLNLPLDACDHLYRIAQEALSNALRHANARVISIEFNVTADTVRLVAADDGRGFGRPAAEASGSGLRSMRYRAASIGGRLWVGPSKEGGTTVIVECANQPLRYISVK